MSRAVGHCPSRVCTCVMCDVFAAIPQLQRLPGPGMRGGKPFYRSESFTKAANKPFKASELGFDSSYDVGEGMMLCSDSVSSQRVPLAK